MHVEPSGQSCGATVTGIDFSQDIDDASLAAIRAAWLEHHVLAFPNQNIDDPTLERVTQLFGVFGPEPFFVPIDGSDHVVALTRRADEKAPVFAETWHTDWSFQKNPPIGTCLYSLVIPPIGGDTTFVNQHEVLAQMPPSLRAKIDGRIARHSAAGGYAPDGMYGDSEANSDRSMKIISSEKARDVEEHPFIMTHEESGKETVFGCVGYIMGIQGMPDEEAIDILLELYEWQIQPRFHYTHQWQENMLVMWDNRSVLHRANGGYDGHARELHRTTIYKDTAKFLK